MIAKFIAIVGGGLSCAVLSLTVPGVADAAPPDNAGGRYLFSKTADGFVRLDTQSGEVAQCSQRSVGWACAAAPEDRAVFENEIARLRRENAALKKDLLSRGLPLPPGTMPMAPDSASGVPLPSDADVDRVMAFVGRAWHRLVEALERAQKQVFNKS
jgi:hypothetical protein